VTVLSGRVELGQGNMTAILQIAADELDLDPADVAIIGGDTTQTPNEGFTSSSLSIAHGGMSVRLAASAARHLLLAEAARLLQSAPDQLTVESGQIKRGGVDTDLDLWKLAETVDLQVEAAAHATPKTPEARRVAGISLPRIDLEGRITGEPFVHDLVFDGMLFGRPVHPPALSSRLVELDMAGLAVRPGVVEAVRDGSFVGVVATSEPEAIAAANWARNRVVYAPPVASPDDAIAAIAASSGEIEVVHEEGDVEAVDGRRFETRISRPYLSHGSIGPSAAVAHWQDGRLRVWSQSQGAYPLRAALGAVFELPLDNIEVKHRPGAGCYGHNGADDVALDAALLARAVPGRPVKVVWSRADEFRYAPLGPGMSVSAKAVVGEDRRIAAMEVLANSAPHGNRPGRNGAPNLRASAYLEKPFPVPRSADIPAANGGGADRNSVPYYTIPNRRSAKRLVHDLPYRTSSMRALGGFANVYAIETLMDEIAHDLGEDPVAFRLRHLDDPRAVAVVEQAAAASKAFIDAKPVDGAGWGIGFARYKNTASYCAVVARIEVDEAIRVTHVRATVDCGEVINPDGVINQTEGGILQAISWTLKEAIIFDGPGVAIEGWSDYPILTFSDVPDVEVSLIPRPDQPPLGCAEAAQGPVAAAIGNALRMAIGVHVKAMPLNRDAIMAALL
jgi:CO/xanthine dehydrogenase Mo-binding subunit